MHNSFEFKVGFQQFANRCPESLKPGRESFVWYIEECKRMGAHSLSMMPVARIPESEKYDAGYLEFSDMGYVREMAALAKEADVHFVVYCIPLMSLAGLKHPVTGQVGMEPAAARKYLDKIIEICDIFGADTLGGGYGKLEVKYSRYNRAVSYDTVKAFVKANLKELGSALEGTNIMMAYENHCDFTGREIAQILEETDHPNIGGMFDIGNGAVICCDPMADVEYLAPWAVAAHFKDFKVVDNPVFEHLWQDMPMIFKGCCLGEGIIDFDVIMRAICEKAKRKNGMILMAEPAFILPEQHNNCLEEMHEFDRKCTRQFVIFMQELVEKY